MTGQARRRDIGGPSAGRPELSNRIGLDPEVAARRTGLQLPPSLPLAAWTRIGKQIGLLRSCSSWWLGDWLTYGRQHFPDRYKQAMAETTLDYQTLRNYAWVAARFTVSRRRDTMSFQHHAAVAALPPAQQELWLDLASSRHWSLAELRAQLKTVLGQTPPPRPQDMVTLQLKITADRHGRWEAAACQHQAALADWAIHILDQAAAQILSEQNSDPAVVVSGFEQAQVRAGMGPPAAGEGSASAGQRMAEPLARLRAVDGNDTKDLAY